MKESIVVSCLTPSFSIITDGKIVLATTCKKISSTLSTLKILTASFESNMDSHLHFELLKDGEYLDPKIYLNAKNI